MKTKYFIASALALDTLCTAYLLTDKLRCKTKEKRNAANEDYYEEAMNGILPLSQSVEYGNTQMLPKLTKDVIARIDPIIIETFVLEVLLPLSPEHFSRLDETEYDAVRNLLTALIGTLRESAPERECTFPVLMSFLVYMDGYEDAVVSKIISDSSEVGQKVDFKPFYQKYRRSDADKLYVIDTAKSVVTAVMEKLYSKYSF